MPLSTIPVLGAGSIVSYEDPDATGTFVNLPECLNIPPVGTSGSFIDTTPVISATKHYIAGQKDTEEAELSMNHQPGNAGYQRFRDLANTNRQLQIRFTFTTGDIATVTANLSGFKTEQVEGSSQIKGMVKYRQSGDPVWTEA